MEIQSNKSDKGVVNLLNKNINHAVKSSQYFRSSLSSLINSTVAPSDKLASNHQQAKDICSSSPKKGGSADCSQSDRSTRILQSPSTTFTRTPDHDGYMWRKYGEKKIAKSMFPRSYYRCTYHIELDCKATKHVQQCTDVDLPMYKVTYFNEHSCDHSNTNTAYADSQQILAFTVNDNNSSVHLREQQLTFSSGGSSVLVSSSMNTQQTCHDQDLFEFESTIENDLSWFDRSTQ